jgi:two-component system, NarL family, sensor kinase
MAESPDTQIAVIFGIGTAGMLLMAGAIILFVVFYQKRMLQEQLRRLDMEADYRQKMLRAALESQENERIRVSKDLHDDVGMMLMTMRAYLNSVTEKTLSQGVVTDIRSLVDDTHETVRRISWDLMPSTLERFGLVQATREMCDRLSMRGAVPVEFKETNTPLTLDKNQETLLYRVIQESVTNALRHAHANKIEVRFNWSKFFLEMSVADDGTGFDLPDGKNKIKNSQGLGLINVESRVTILGAQLSYESNDPSGTIVNVKLKASHDG